MSTPYPNVTLNYFTFHPPLTVTWQMSSGRILTVSKIVCPSCEPIGCPVCEPLLIYTIYTYYSHMYLSVSWFETFTKKTKTRDHVQETYRRRIKSSHCLWLSTPSDEGPSVTVSDEEPPSVTVSDPAGVRNFCVSRHHLDYPSPPSSPRLRETRVLPFFFLVGWGPLETPGALLE